MKAIHLFDAYVQTMAANFNMALGINERFCSPFCMTLLVRASITFYVEY